MIYINITNFVSLTCITFNLYNFVSLISLITNINITDLKKYHSMIETRHLKTVVKMSK